MLLFYTYYYLLSGLSYDTYSRYLFFGCLFEFFCLSHVVRVFVDGLPFDFLVVFDCHGFCWITVLVVVFLFLLVSFFGFVFCFDCVDFVCFRVWAIALKNNITLL